MPYETHNCLYSPLFSLSTLASPDPSDEVMGLIRSFYREAKTRGAVPDQLYTGLNVEFGLMFPGAPPDTVAYCDMRANHIVISRKQWDKLDTAQREEMMYHELGHCVLRRDHRSDTNPTTHIPSSMMYPNILPGKVYLAHKEAYLRELFTGF